MDLKIYNNNNIVYKGSWSNCSYNGFGLIYDNNGKKFYKGRWKNGDFHGTGILFHNDRTYSYCNYENGSIINTIIRRDNSIPISKKND
jgi:hypothetical protein